MMKMRCLIIDDEPLAHEVILKYIADIPFLDLAGQCYRATQAFDFLAGNEIDLIFLDIRMPKLNGLDFLRTLQHKPLVIVTSAYEEYALESFDLNVCDYLLKPFRFDRFLKATNRAMEMYNLKNGQATVQHNTDLELLKIAIKVDKKTMLINQADITFLESLGNYVKVWCNQKFYLTPRTLSSFEEQLPAENFIRIHKSFMLNKIHLHYLEANNVHLKNGQLLPVGKNYKQLVKQLLNKE